MAVELIGPIQRWQGLSTDVKPTSGVKAGSVFYETDTKKEYKYTAAGWVDVTSIVDTILTKSRNPFGKGSLTTNGVQYSTEISGITHAAYTAIETITFYQPTGMTLEEVEFGLTMAIKSSGATKYVKWKFQASDNGTDWQDLIAEQTRAANASAYLDVTVSGRFAPTGNFLGAGASFQVRGVIKAEDAVETAAGKAKNSSYILARYRRA